MDENELIAATVKGSQDAFRRLVERYQTGLIIYCEKMVRSREDAEDIAQDAFVKAYKNLEDFNSTKARFSTWLYRIAANQAIDFLRKQKRVSLSGDVDLAPDQYMPSELHYDEIEQLRQAIETLEPPKFAEIIKAYYWQGKSYEQIAAMFGTNTNTVGTWMRRAKLQLKSELKEERV